MPFETACTANTPETVHECMCTIYNMSRAQRRDHRVSIVYGSGRLQVAIGDDLDLVNPVSQKSLKKRWWELHKYGGDQLRLPFSEYKPAKIDTMSWNTSRSLFSMRLIFADVTDASRNIDVKACLDPTGINHLVKAIRLHRCIGELPTREPSTSAFEEWGTATTANNEGVVRRPRRAEGEFSHEGCELLIRRALYTDGVAITGSGAVYNDATGEHIGSDFTIESPEELIPAEPEVFQRPESTRGSIRTLNGARFYFATTQPIEWVSEDLGACISSRHYNAAVVGRFRMTNDDGDESAALRSFTSGIDRTPRDSSSGYANYLNSCLRSPINAEIRHS